MVEPAGHRDIVLVVDDSPETLGFLTEAIERSGRTVLVATEGAAAVALVERITPDIILMDAVMPGMDGFETCRRLKIGPAAHVPVIFMTGLSETEDIVKGLGAGGVDYVTKPITPDELIARIRVHLANARATNSARAALDTAGRYLFATSRRGRVLWCTPQAGRLIAELPGEDGGVLPAALRGWVETGATGTAPEMPPLPDGRKLALAFLGKVGDDELLFRLSNDDSGREAELLKEHFPVTPREGEVLLWIARGKSNRDIGDILGLSPRTVNKHLETIYAKLGVENRASAAVLAIRALGER
jgi:DNA-binding NarL/FixJ family response regulator